MNLELLQPPCRHEGNEVQQHKKCSHPWRNEISGDRNHGLSLLSGQAVNFHCCWSLMELGFCRGQTGSAFPLPTWDMTGVLELMHGQWLWRLRV
jgi:hypothetical protein